MEGSNFIEREWHEGIEGEIDENGFFITPNGSFWDPDYVYFNREGFDKHGGYYDQNIEYIPGDGWNDELMCYWDEIEDNKRNKRKGGKNIDDEQDIDNKDVLFTPEVNLYLKGRELYDIRNKRKSENIKMNSIKKNNYNYNKYNNKFNINHSNKYDNCYSIKFNNNYSGNHIRNQNKTNENKRNMNTFGNIMEYNNGLYWNVKHRQRNINIFENERNRKNNMKIQDKIEIEFTNSEKKEEEQERKKEEENDKDKESKEEEQGNSVLSEVKLITHKTNRKERDKEHQKRQLNIVIENPENANISYETKSTSSSSKKIEQTLEQEQNIYNNDLNNNTININNNFHCQLTINPIPNIATLHEIENFHNTLKIPPFEYNYQSKNFIQRAKFNTNNDMPNIDNPKKMKEYNTILYLNENPNYYNYPYGFMPPFIVMPQNVDKQQALMMYYYHQGAMQIAKKKLDDLQTTNNS